MLEDPKQNNSISDNVARPPQQEEHQLADMLGDFKALAELAPIGIFQALQDGKCIFANQYWYQLTSATPNMLIGKDWYDFVAAEDSLHIKQEWRKAITDNENFSASFKLKAPDDKPIWVECTATIMPTRPNRPKTFLAVASNITEQHLYKQNLEYLAHTDSLTGICNRTMFQEKLKSALLRNVRTNKYVVILFLDLDGFKIINDTLGHNSGDILLKQVADRLAHHIRKTDTIARMGGDEFTILFEDVDSPSRITVSAKKVSDAFIEPFLINDNEVFVTASIGIAVASKDMTDYQALIKQADIAMYQAKENGKNSFHYFTEELDIEVHRKMQISGKLYRALEQKELIPFYQPQINMATKEIVGFEVLLRWQTPELGAISPAEFIPIAEDNGLIIPISEWLIKEACLQLVQYNSKNTSLKNIHMSINLSPKHFNSKSLFTVISEIIQETKVPPQNIYFEVTESILIRDRQETKRLLNQLKSLGVSIALDDFGTGYSSLSYLRHFPIDVIKIDQSFIKQLFVEPANASIVMAIIALSKSLNLQLIAEGVETKEIADFLLKNGCDIGQGFLYAKPMPAEQMLIWRP